MTSIVKIFTLQLSYLFDRNNNGTSSSIACYKCSIWHWRSRWISQFFGKRSLLQIVSLVETVILTRTRSVLQWSPVNSYCWLIIFPGNAPLTIKSNRLIVWYIISCIGYNNVQLDLFCEKKTQDPSDHRDAWSSSYFVLYWGNLPSETLNLCRCLHMRRSPWKRRHQPSSARLLHLGNEPIPVITQSGAAVTELHLTGSEFHWRKSIWIA